MKYTQNPVSIFPNNVLLQPHETLKYYGINGITLNWFNSYLSNRSQYVEIDNVLSTKMVINTGVPQGSNIGTDFVPHIYEWHTQFQSGISIRPVRRRYYSI